MTWSNLPFGKSSFKNIFAEKFLNAVSLIYCLVIRSSTGGFLLLRDISGIVSQPRDIRVSLYVVSVDT